jgi:hypothetical protein
MIEQQKIVDMLTKAIKSRDITVVESVNNLILKQNNKIYKISKIQNRVEGISQ